MIAVNCPECGRSREVSARKPWMVGEQPFLKICRQCTQVGKVKTPEHRRKLSESATAAYTPESRKALSDYRKANPETWENNIRVKGGTYTHDQDTKTKIGESVRIAAEKRRNSK